MKKWYVVILLALTLLISACGSNQNGASNMNSESAIQEQSNESDDDTDVNAEESFEDDSEIDEYTAEMLAHSKKALEVQEQMQGTWQSEAGYQLIFSDDNIQFVGIELYESRTYIIGEEGLRGFQEGKFEYTVYENFEVYYDHRTSSLGIEIKQIATIPILEFKPEKIALYIDDRTIFFEKQ